MALTVLRAAVVRARRGPTGWPRPRAWPVSPQPLFVGRAEVDFVVLLIQVKPNVRTNASVCACTQIRSGGRTMTTLLHISASPRGDASESSAIAGTFLSVYRELHPQAVIDTWDLWDGALPEFGPAAVHAKMAVIGGADPTGDQAAAWLAARTAFGRFASADRTCSASLCGTPASRTSSSSSST